MLRLRSVCAAGIVVVQVIAVCVVSAACSTTVAPTTKNQSQQDHSCNLSMLLVGPEGFAPYGLARAGPLWFSAFGRVDPGTPARLATPNGPYDGWKVVIHPDPEGAGTVDLSGTQCSTGTAVRFCYSNNACDWTSRLQSSVVTLPVNVTSHLDYTGYMVFPGPGLMRLSASDSHGVVGVVVIEVPQVSN
jgi:hypothetical protein